MSRGVLLAILAVQAVLSLRMHSAAFEDEELYLTAGHQELAHLLYGVRSQRLRLLLFRLARSVPDPRRSRGHMGRAGRRQARQPAWPC